MKILVTTFSFPDAANGSYDGRFVLSEAKAYVRNGASVLVLTPHYPGSRRDESPEPGLDIHRFRYFLPTRWERVKIPGQPIYRARSVLALLQVPLLLAAFAWGIFRRARHVDVIHAQWTVTAMLALPAKWVFGTPVVVTARGSDIRLLPAAVNRFIHRQVDGAIDCFRALPWSAWYKRTYPARFLALPLIVDCETGGTPPDDIDDFRDLCRGAFVILYAGRFDPEKVLVNRLPLFDIICAIRVLRDRGLRLHLVYVGQGHREIEGAMRRAIMENAVQDEVTLLGPRMDIAPYARASHLGVGGIGLNGVAQDFIFSRTPQLLMLTDENRDTPWRDGGNAVMVAPGSVTCLVDRMEWALTHRETLERLAQQALEDFGEYLADTGRGGRLYLEAFRDLTDDTGASARRDLGIHQG